MKANVIDLAAPQTHHEKRRQNHIGTKVVNDMQAGHHLVENISTALDDAALAATVIEAATRNKVNQVIAVTNVINIQERKVTREAIAIRVAAVQDHIRGLGHVISIRHADIVNIMRLK